LTIMWSSAIVKRLRRVRERWRRIIKKIEKEVFALKYNIVKRKRTYVVHRPSRINF